MGQSGKAQVDKTRGMMPLPALLQVADALLACKLAMFVDSKCTTAVGTLPPFFGAWPFTQHGLVDDVIVTLGLGLVIRLLHSLEIHIVPMVLVPLVLVDLLALPGLSALLSLGQAQSERQAG